MLQIFHNPIDNQSDPQNFYTVEAIIDDLSEEGFTMMFNFQTIENREKIEMWISKTNLNNLLDRLDRTDGLITIFTTEKSPEEMAFNSENGKYQASFFREGSNPIKSNVLLAGLEWN